MKLKSIYKSYGDISIFEDFSIEFEEGKTVAVMGASGVGKSTLLNIITGLTDFSGTVDTKGEISVVFSEPALLKNLTVEENLRYAVAHAYPDKKQLAAGIEAVLNSVELWDRRRAYPGELSTGMAQRVQLARGFLFPSDYLIMDEAFRGLDTALKIRLRNYFLKLNAEKPKTVIMFTHELDDALFLADRLVLLESRPVEIALDRRIALNKERRTYSSPEINRIREAYMRRAVK